MGKPSAKTTVVDYFMSVHMGIALEVDSLLGVYVNDREVWSGVSTTVEGLPVNKPDLFGGVKKEGGAVGTIIHLPGRPDQVLPPEVASRFGLTPETSPAYRGLTSVMFVGDGGTVSGAPVGPGGVIGGLLEEIGSRVTAGQGGFKWSTNSPIVAQKVAFKVQRKPKTGLNQAHAMIGGDANPAHMIYECLTNTDWGMGSPTSDIDHASFNAAAQTLYDENFGLSIIWTRQTEIESFIGEINDHIQGVIYLNRRTGKWKLRLIRDDYDINTLRVLTPDNADLSGFERRMWGDVANEVTVGWTNPANEQEETVTAQDLASAHIQGSPVTLSRTYYGVRNATLAMTLAQRDVRAASAALASANAVLNREAWAIEPGDVVILNWPEYQLSGVIMRVGECGYGRPGESSIKVSLLEDIFSLEKPPIVTPPGSQWEDPGKPPTPMAATEIITVPNYFVLSGDLQATARELVYPEVEAAVFGYQNNPDAVSFELMAEGVGSTGATAFYPQGSKSIVERTVLANPMAAAVESRLPDAQVINKKRGPEIGGFMWLGAGSDTNMEIAQVIAYDEVPQEWVLARGVLDTVPRDWPIGTPVWFVNPGDRVTDDRTIRSAGEEVEYKLLTRTSRGVLPLADAPIISETLTARPHLPLRPGNVKVNGTAFGSVAAGAEIEVTWATRNRNLEDGQVVRWDGLPVPPEYAQGTIITVVAGGNPVYVQKLWTENEVTFDPAWFARWADARIYVTSTREGLDSLQGHSIGITGLANDPGAPAPPTPPDPGPPPSMGNPPEEGAWSAVGYAFEKDEGGVIIGSVPAILVSGVRDRPDAVGLIVRYSLDSVTDWFVLPTLALTDAPTQVATTAVRPDTDYKVQVAYVDADGTLSGWRSLGVVTTGAMIVSGIGDIGYINIKNALEFLGTFTDVEREALNHLGEITSDMRINAESIIGLVLRNAETRDRIEAMTHLPDGQTIGNFVIQEREQRLTDTEAFNSYFNFLGSVGPSGNAWIINGLTTWINPTMSFAAFENYITASFENQSAAISLVQTVTLDAVGAVVSELHRLGAANPSGNGFIIDDANVTLLSSGQSIVTKFNAITGQIADFKADAINESKLYVDNSSAFAQVLSSQGVSAGGFSARITQLTQTSTAFGAKFGLRLDVNGHVTGFTALNDGITGAFVFVADYFSITTPGGNVTPFVVFNGAVYMPNVIVQKLDANVIDTVHLKANSIVADKIVGGAVSNLLSYELGSSTLIANSGQTVGISFSYTGEGGKLSVDVYGDVGTTTSTQAGVIVRLLCDGVVIGDGATFVQGSWGRQGCSFPVTFFPSAGAHNYQVTYEKTPGSGALRINKTYCKVTELKK